MLLATAFLDPNTRSINSRLTIAIIVLLREAPTVIAPFRRPLYLPPEHILPLLLFVFILLSTYKNSPPLLLLEVDLDAVL